MASVYEQKNRVVFPRWRDFYSTSISGDIKPFSEKPLFEFNESDIAQKINDWNHEKTVGNAIDLLNSSFNLGLKETSKQAAEFVLQNKKIIPSGLARIIKTVNEEGYGKDETLLNHNFDRNIINKHFHNLISIYRKRIANYPYNAIAWVELARLHAIVNNIDKAERALIIALNLAPENRYVLRSLARFFVHTHQPEKALFYLKKSQSIKVDPWLLSTHISISNQNIGKSSHYIKQGFSLIESKKFSAFDINELASSLGTIELYSGATKSARKLFNTSMLNPNDNAVAQAGWASKHINGVLIPEQSLNIPCAYEARAIEFYSQGKYKEALDESIKWLLDEPFASRPARLSSHLASTYLDDYRIASELSLFALQVNPDNFDLMNNLAFSLCLENKPLEAEKVYSRIHFDSLNDKEKVVYTATRGLMYYRSANPVRGKELYQEALNKAKEMEEDGLYRLALVNYLREEAIVNPSSMNEINPLLENLKNTSKEDQIRIELDKIVRILNNSIKGKALDNE